MDTLLWIGDIFLETTSKSVDISQSVISIEITEDIFSPCIMGHILIQEMPSNDIMGAFAPDALIGKGEELKLNFIAKIGTYLQEIKGYHVYKVEPIAPNDPFIPRQKMFYKIYFASRIFFTNELVKVHKYFEGKYSSTVSKLCKDYLGIELAKVEKTKSKQAIYFPYITPLEAINICAARSISAENDNDANFVFYGDIDNKFYFVSLGSLMQTEPIVGTNDEDGITVTTPFGTNYFMNNQINKGPTKHYAIQYEIKPISPIMNLINGTYSATLFNFDVAKRKYSKKDYKYSEEFPKSRHLDKKPLLTKGLDLISLSEINPQCNTSYFTSSHWLHDENETSEEFLSSVNSAKEYYLKRRSQMQQINQMGLEIELPGNPTIKIGQTIFFGRPQIDKSGSRKKKRNPYVQGKYLITRKTTKLENSKAEGNAHGFSLSTTFSLRKDSDPGTI